MRGRPVGELVAHQTVLCGAASMTVAEAAKSMCDARVGAIMIVEAGRLVGIFTERDALYRVLAQGKDPKQVRMRDVMTANPTTVSPDTTVGAALLLMHDNGFRHVPVTENGQPIGMISARDALGPEMIEFESELGKREHLTEILG
jgi:CBS domain-containing protein